MIRPLTIFDPALVATMAPKYSDLPDNYAGLMRWYYASDYDDDGLADNAVVVNNWTDHSSALVDATPDGTYPPHYKTSFMPTGKSCIHFPDGWHHFDHTQLTLGDCTFILVWRTMGDTIPFSSTSGNYQVRETSGATLFHSPYFYPGVAPALINSTASNLMVWVVESWRRTKSSGVPRFGLNKTYVGEGTAQTNTANMLCNTVGLYNGYGAAYYIAEVCIYNTVLLDAELDSLFDGYFNVKYLGDIGSA